MVASWLLVLVLAREVPPFPKLGTPSLSSRTDARRCEVGAVARDAEHEDASDCALVGSRWVATRRGALVDDASPGEVRHVRIGGRTMVVAEVIPPPTGATAGGRDVVLLRLTDDVPGYPLAPPPGERPTHAAPILAYIEPFNAWIAHATRPHGHGHGGSCPATRRGRATDFVTRFLRG